jgi:hypothetical protein
LADKINTSVLLCLNCRLSAAFLRISARLLPI